MRFSIKRLPLPRGARFYFRSLPGPEAFGTQYLPLGEGGFCIGSSEPMQKTDEGNPAAKLRKQERFVILSERLRESKNPVLFGLPFVRGILRLPLVAQDDSYFAFRLRRSLPSSAPVCALGHLPPGEGMACLNPLGIRLCTGGCASACLVASYRLHKIRRYP